MPFDEGDFYTLQAVVQADIDDLTLLVIYVLLRLTTSPTKNTTGIGDAEYNLFEVIPKLIHSF